MLSSGKGFLLFLGTLSFMTSSTSYLENDRMKSIRRGLSNTAFVRVHESLHPRRLRLRGGSPDICDAVNNTITADETQLEHTPLLDQNSRNSTEEIMQEGLAKFLYTNGVVFYNKVQVVNRDLSVLMLRYLGELRDKERLEALERKLAFMPNKTEQKSIEFTNDSTTVVPTFTAATADFGEAGVIASSGNNEDERRVTQDQTENSHGANATVLNTALPFQPDASTALPDNNSSAPGAAKLRKGLDVLDALSATGLRALRYTLEVPCVEHVTANDINPEAVRLIKRNIALNNISQDRITHSQHDALALMQVVEPLVCVSIDFYIRLFVRVKISKLGAQMGCLKFGMVNHCRGCESYEIQPLAHGGVSKTSATNVDIGPATLVNTASSRAFNSPPQRCCGANSKIVLGPVWIGPLAERKAVARMEEMLEEDGAAIASATRLRGLLTLLAHEVPTPLFMSHSAMCKILKVVSPKLGGMRGLIKEAGYNVSQSHIDPQAIKTNAPIALIWDLLRVWERTHPVKSKDGVAASILDQEPQVINQTRLGGGGHYRLRFDQPDPCLQIQYSGGAGHGEGGGVEDEDGKRVASGSPSVAVKRRKVQLYPHNPEPEWGPKRATRMPSGLSNPRDHDPSGGGGGGEAARQAALLGLPLETLRGREGGGREWSGPMEEREPERTSDFLKRHTAQQKRSAPQPQPGGGGGGGGGGGNPAWRGQANRFGGRGPNMETDD